MGGGDDSPIRPHNSYKYWWCANCGAQFGENTGQWVRGWEIAKGTSPSRFQKSRAVPAGVCPGCESSNIHEPLANQQRG